MNSGYAVLTKDLIDDPIFIEIWRDLLLKSNNTLKMQQSPEWYQSLRYNKNKESCNIAIVRNNKGEIVGIAPFSIGPKKIKFDIKAKIIFHLNFKFIDIEGSVPLIESTKECYDHFFRDIYKIYPDCDGFYFDSVPVHSFLWKYFYQLYDCKDFFLHSPEGLRRHFTIELPDTFDEYLKSFSKNKRKQIKKQIRTFENISNGDYDFIRYEHTDQISDFLKKAENISMKSWQYKIIGPRILNREEENKRLKVLAEKKILRSYILEYQGKPVAFRLGYQFDNFYNGAEIGYDQEFKDLSPGKILTLYTIKDLIENKPPKIADFGIGYAQWKRDLCNRESEDLSIFLFRNNLYNKVIAHSQKTFYSAIETAKKIKSRFDRKQ